VCRTEGNIRKVAKTRSENRILQLSDKITLRFGAWGIYMLILMVTIPAEKIILKYKVVGQDN
jgi:hypothetical protein